MTLFSTTKCRAVHYLEEVRNRALELACLRSNPEPRHHRQVRRLPEDFRQALESTLV